MPTRVGNSSVHNDDPRWSTPSISVSSDTTECSGDEGSPRPIGSRPRSRSDSCLIPWDSNNIHTRHQNTQSGEQGDDLGGEGQQYWNAVPALVTAGLSFISRSPRIFRSRSSSALTDTSGAIISSVPSTSPHSPGSPSSGREISPPPTGHSERRISVTSIATISTALSHITGSRPGSRHQDSNEPAFSSNRDQTTRDDRPKSLWEEAWDQLPGKEKDRLRLTHASAVQDNINGHIILQQVRNRREELIQQSAEIVLGASAFKLRDVFDNVISWLQRFVAVGDCLMQYDPIHAAIPWAVIRFILQCAINAQEIDTIIIEGIEYIGSLLARYIYCEASFLSRRFGLPQPSNRDHLREGLLKVYIAILRFLAKAHHYVGSFTTGIKGKNRALKSAFDDIIDKAARVQEDIEHAETQAHLNYYITKKRHEMLQWITTIDYEMHHKVERENLLENTGDWLFAHPLFRDWHSSASSAILWLRGIPGSGKTKLTCQVIEKLLPPRVGRSENAYAYFYCKRGGATTCRSDPAIILHALIKQLCQFKPEATAILEHKYTEEWEQGLPAGRTGTISFSEGEKLILKLAQMYNHTTIFLDGLEEVERWERGKLLNLLQQLHMLHPNVVRLFVSSGEKKDIRAILGREPNLIINATEATRNADDIERFIEREIDIVPHRKDFRDLITQHDLLGKVKQKLRDQANGMFQWVNLQIEVLASMSTKDDIEANLGKLPRSLEASYERLWFLIEEEHGVGRHLALAALQWLFCANTREGLARDLWAALACSTVSRTVGICNEDFETVFGLCRNLVQVHPMPQKTDPYERAQNSTHDPGEGELHPEYHIVEFAHVSVQEFLQKHFTGSQCHCMAAITCLQVLMDDSSSQSIDDVKDPVGNARELVHKYAAERWIYHVHHYRSSPSFDFAKVGPWIQQFFSSSSGCSGPPAFSRWLDYIRPRLNEKMKYPFVGTWVKHFPAHCPWLAEFDAWKDQVRA
ncbi:hypothetical protein BDZ91DRAFT_850969 [Kalaharituber pfeilii]|nr:hypothetical protein BDZ91DRAFT_850969 [Kalaharituber pfeilii]